MLYREMPKTGDKLSILGFGCMRLPGSAARINEAEAISQIRHAIGQGVNYFDTAWPYHNGNSEVVLGKALGDGYREKVKVADKLPHWLCKKREDMDYYLDEQLRRLDIKKIDYYLIHMLDGSTWRKARDMGVIDFMDQAKASGKIDHIGFSFHGPREDFKTVIDEYDWEFCQIQYNILDKHAQAGIEGLEYARSKNIGVIIMEPLRGGSLAGELPKEVEAVYRANKPERSNADWALRWIWNHPGIITVLSGMNSMDQINENISIASDADINSMSREENDTVGEAAETFRTLMQVPCTGCQYCMPCPKGVDIPSAFSFYNQKYLFKQPLLSRATYLLQHGTIQGRTPSLASQCAECGLCMTHCPQGILIPEELKKVEKEFEGLFTKPINLLLKVGISAGRRKD